ncbi:VPLPA-CTERM sorting domain-containing protein [uncultured Shimia sp.]|uniref:VPLPA-CTERM sorting domain-containing protein n=1 Tax=uncultured Shimia sp. TaxID=573152 RepID=UPI0026388550|nr:VPLPA-CTERM sorting domain-containing protein [uncultured Shimia sp.]
MRRRANKSEPQTVVSLRETTTQKWPEQFPNHIAQGSSIDFYLEEGKFKGFGSSVTTGITFVGNDIAPIPLPAAAPMLLAGIGAIGFAGRRRKKKKAA